MAEKTVSVETSRALALTEQVLRGAGVPAADAAFVAESLILAEMSRMPSHGLLRLKPTLARIQSGDVNPRPRMTLQKTAENILLLDADGALGQVAGKRALEEAAPLAKKTGVAVAAIRRAFHFGMLSRYTNLAAESGLLCFMCTNSSAQMAAWGGMKKVLGTNPFAFAFPTGENTSFSLDISTAAAARGKIRLAALDDRPLPPGWAMDREGRDTQHAQAAMDGAVLPMAGHKGFGMAMAVDFLSAVLTGADLSYEASNMFEGREKVNTGALMVLMDPGFFLPRDQYESRVSAWLDAIRSSPPRPGEGGVRIPGDTCNALRADRPKEITLSQAAWAEAQGLLDALKGGNP